MKYLTLLYYFNALPATLSVIVMAIIWCTLQAHVHCQEGLWDWRWRGFLPTSLVFFAVLFSWHHLRAKYRRHRVFIFLDKVCIDQKDSHRKAEGIKAIGGILNCSRTLLVAWDRSYFSRLWCTFELAAFFHSQPEGKVICLPIILGRVTTEIALCSWGLELVRVFVDKATRNLFAFLVSLAVATRFHDFLEEVDELSTALKDFEARRAECFCCCNGHRHPTTHEILACDRQLVEGSIAHWYGRGNVEEGLRRFDALIRGPFRERIREVVRGARMPYHLILLASVWPAMHQLDHIVEECAAPWPRGLRCAHIMFLGFPLVFAVLMSIMRRLMHVAILGKCTRTFIFAIANCLLHWAAIESNRVINRAFSSWLNLFLCSLFLLAQSVTVFYFFQDGGTKQQTVKVARRVQSALRGPKHLEMTEIEAPGAVVAVENKSGSWCNGSDCSGRDLPLKGGGRDRSSTH